MIHIPRRFLSVALVFAALVLAGCGGQQVGNSNSLKDIKDKQQGNLGALPSPSPSPVAPPTQAPAPVAPPPQTIKPAPVQTTKPAPPPAPQFQISINPDTSSNPGFNPQNASVTRGTVVVWTNNDTRVHTISATNGAFNGTVAPGAKFSWTASVTGKISYGDPNVPYDVGTLTVS